MNSIAILSEAFGRGVAGPPAGARVSPAGITSSLEGSYQTLTDHSVGAGEYGEHRPPHPKR
jgi:hypothetical protein